MGHATLNDLEVKIEAAKTKHGIGGMPQVGGPAPRPHHEAILATLFDGTIIGVLVGAC